MTSAVDLTTWEYWWLYNKDSYLQLRAHIDAIAPQSGDEANLTDEAAWNLALQRIQPVVLEALQKEGDVEPALAALVALTRTCDGALRSQAGSLVKACESRRTEANRSLAETSVIALGILGSESAAADLCGLLRDTAEARRALGNKEVPERMRAFAGLALGLLGAKNPNEDLRRFIVHHLAQQLAEEPGAEPDTQAACVLALGLIPLSQDEGDTTTTTAGHESLASSSCAAEVGLLLGILDDTSGSDCVRAHTPKALASLARSPRLRERVVRSLLARIADKNEKGEVRQGCVLALGGLLGGTSSALESEARETLLKQFETGDLQARCFATIALAQSSARAQGEAVEATRRLLNESMNAGRSVRERSWSALALGVLEHGHLTTDGVSAASALSLARGLRNARTPEEVGAFAIACGLARVGDAAPVLLDHLASVKEARALGYVSLALGMIQVREALEPLHALLEESRTSSEKLPQTALALALLEDSTLVQRLVSLLEQGSSQSTRQAAATALGWAGDRRAVDALVGLLHDRTSIASTRGAAVAALGRVCDRDRLPWQEAVAEGLNYRAMTLTLSSEGRTGLLDIR